MVTKTLTIMEDAYEMLKAAKKENESFSDVIRREFSSKKNDLKKFWGSIDNETANIVRETIKKSRELSRKRMKNYDMS
jgi:predicted CopG family antitoxin